MSDAVLLMAHGTPDALDEMPEYLTRVRNGRPPSPDLVDEITASYRAIGGRSPLTDLTRAQASALQARLGTEVRVLVGMRNWKPFISDVIREASAGGVTRVVGIPLAPQFSTLSVQKYVEAARAATPRGVSFACVGAFHDHPGLAEAFAGRIDECRDELAAGARVVFTAHSLPVRVVESGDPYAGQVAATAAAVAAKAGICDYGLAWQSAGRTPEPWLGPDIGALIREEAAAGVRRFLVVPIGFVCDHTEVLFDLDIKAAQAAREAGAAFRRTASLNTSPAFIRLLAELASALLAARD